MNRTFISFLVYSLWLGGGLFLAFIAAPAAFRAAPNPSIAADVVGRMMDKWHYIALLAPLVLLIGEWRTSRLARTRIVLILSAALFLASAQSFVDLRIRAMRFDSIIPISELPEKNYTRREFGRLHGISMTLMLLQILAAAGAAYPYRAAKSPAKVGEHSDVRPKGAA